MKYEVANEFLKNRLTLPTALHSRGISDALPPAVRAHCFFSARVAEARVLEKLRKISDAFSRGDLGLSEARTQLQKWLDNKGIGDPSSAAITNISSSMRLNLILRQNAAMAAAVGRYQVSRDPDIEERWPCWKYITGSNPRPEHAALNGKVLRKSDPFWKTHYPPWDFNCNCDVEDSDEEPQKAPPHDDRAPASGFQFDPAEPFREFDMSSIEDERLRKRVVEKMRKKFDMSLGNDFKKLFAKKDPEESINFEAKGMEEAQNQTKKLMPGAVVDLNGIRNPQAVNKLNRCIGIVKQEAGLDEVKVILADANMRDQTAGSFSEEKGILRLNPKHLNRSDQWDGLKVRENGAYDGLFSNIYRGKEVESIIFHELYHAAALKIVKGKDGAERYRKLREAYDRAKKEKFNLSKHGMDDEYEFLSELKTGKQLANAEYPDYIENMLKEFFL